MRDALAERLLARVMAWTEHDVATHRPVLQALAMLKYDEYQQFAPGMRFVESLAYWLEQFPPKKRPFAYEFVRRRLIFFSEAEMAHFAAILFADFIRPILLEHVAGLAGVPPWRPREILGSEAYRDLQRRVVVLGLSDGARIDQFRRATTALRHDQIFGSYDLSPERLTELRAFLAGPQGAPQTASTLVLLDDFAGSGSSYVREEASEPKGKVARFLQRVQTDEGWRSLVSFPETLVVVALYVATARRSATCASNSIGSPPQGRGFGSVWFSPSPPTSASRPVSIRRSTTSSSPSTTPRLRPTPRGREAPI